MKPKFLKSLPILFIPCFMWFGFSKENSSNITTQQGGTNLIKNSNFEINGQQSDSGWYFFSYLIHRVYDISHQRHDHLYVTDAPENGGSWSIELQPYRDYVDYYITGISGANTFNLSFWWKIKRRWEHYVYQNASISIGVLSNDSLVQQQTMTIPNQDTAWTQHTLICPINTSNTDTIVIRLYGGSAMTGGVAISSGLFLFNKIQLTK